MHTETVEDAKKRFGAAVAAYIARVVKTPFKPRLKYRLKESASPQVLSIAAVENWRG